MKNLKLRKLVAVALAVMTIATVSPIGASAAWKQNSTGWWNTEGDSWSTGWSKIDSTWYNFGSDGYMKTGWANDNGTWYYLNPVSDGTKGAMKTGWVNDGGKWYFTAPSGEMKTGWVNDGGTWYFTAPSGEMKTGWVNDGGTWYFTAASGAMQTGVVEVDGKIYYLAPSGAMATGAVTINGVTYTFATSGEAIGDKIPTPTVAFTSSGTTVETKTPGTTTGTTGSSSGGGGSHNNSGNSSNDITSLISSAYSTKIASILTNHPTLADNVSVDTTKNPIVVTLLDSKLESLQTVFNTAQGQDLSLIEARLTKAEEIMDLNSGILKVGGVSFKEYLAQADANGSFNISEIAKKISNNTLTYAEFKTNLEDKIIAMCDETKKAPEVSVSYGTISETVTKIQKDGTTIYDTSLSRDTNIKGLVSLGDTTTGTYTIYCGDAYFTVKIS